MNSLFKNILVGMGSAFALYPSGSVAEIELSHQSDADKLRGDWERVGTYLYSAMQQADNEQESKASR